MEHQPNAIPNAKPITVGQGYSTIAWLPDVPSSWVLPCLHERIAPTEHPIGKAVTQLRKRLFNKSNSYRQDTKNAKKLKILAFRR